MMWNEIVDEEWEVEVWEVIWYVIFGYEIFYSLVFCYFLGIFVKMYEKEVLRYNKLFLKYINNFIIYFEKEDKCFLLCYF